MGRCGRARLPPSRKEDKWLSRSFALPIFVASLTNASAWLLQEPSVADSTGDIDLIEVVQQRQGVFSSGIDEVLELDAFESLFVAEKVEQDRVSTFDGGAVHEDATIEADNPFVLEERLNQFVGLFGRKTKLFGNLRRAGRFETGLFEKPLDGGQLGSVGTCCQGIVFRQGVMVRLKGELVRSKQIFDDLFHCSTRQDRRETSAKLVKLQPGAQGGCFVLLADCRNEMGFELFDHFYMGVQIGRGFGDFVCLGKHRKQVLGSLRIELRRLNDFVERHDALRCGLQRVFQKAFICLQGVGTIGQLVNQPGPGASQLVFGPLRGWFRRR